MSLTSFIKEKEVKELFSNEFDKPKDKITGEIKASPITNNYGMIGTAFDYLMRFYLKCHNPNAVDKAWVAEHSCKMTESYPLVYKKASSNLEFAKTAYSRYLKSGIIDDEIIKSSIFLAQLDPIYRAGRIDENMGSVNERDIQDLKNLISLVRAEEFNSNKYCLLNPTFNEASSLVGGADADIIIDNQLIDIKTTKKLEISREMFNQIIGYYVLGWIGGIGNERIDISNITDIGFYFSRYGIKYMYKVEDIINPTTFSDFVDNFIDYAKKMFPQTEIRDKINENIKKIL